MQTYEVRIMGQNGRALRAMYGGKDLSGPGLHSDPIVSEAIRAWEKCGCPDNEPIQVKVDAVMPEPEAPAVIEPRYLGGGMYELPDGSRVRGKQAALEALAA